MSLADLIISGGLPFPWAEIIEDTSQSSGRFRDDDGRLTMVMQVNFLDYIDTSIPDGVVPSLVGWAIRSTGGMLQRGVPWQHPIQQHFRCVEITSAKGIGYVGNSDDDPDLVTPYGQFAVWKRVNLGLAFATLPYECLPDSFATGGDESYRFCKFAPPAGYVDSINIPNSNMQFNRAAPVPMALQGTTPIGSSSYSRVIGKSSCDITWYCVPEDAFRSPTNPLLMPNIGPIIGTTNASAWHGNPAQSLYLQAGPDIRSATSPVDPSSLGVSGVGTPAQFFDITFKIKRFTQWIAGTEYGAWNSVPYTKDTGGGTPDGIYYPVSFDGMGVNTFIPVADWSKLIYSL